MEVKRRRSFPVSEQGVRTVDALEKPSQVRRNFEDHPATPCCHQRQVANKLDDITQALFRVYEDRLPVEVPSIPKRLLVVTGLQRRTFHPPSPSVIFPSVLEGPHHQAKASQVFMRLWEIRFDGEGLVVAGGGILKPP